LTASPAKAPFSIDREREDIVNLPCRYYIATFTVYHSTKF
jgi:hypothetical protein